MALFGPDGPGWRRLFLKVKQTAELRALTSEFDPGCVKTGRGLVSGIQIDCVFHRLAAPEGV
jgi:hypothetical protein